MDITNENRFLKSIDAEKNENGQYIYQSMNGHSSMNLPYVLKEYIQWLSENKKADSIEDLEKPLGYNADEMDF